MKNSTLNKLAEKLTKAFVSNKLINPLPSHCTKKLKNAEIFRKLCESKVKDPIIGFKAAGTGFPLMKKFGEKEPFYASIFKMNFLKSGQKIKINKSTLGIELEVCYKIKKSFFENKKIITFKNITKYISHIAPCIEVIGYRQKKNIVKGFGDLCSDFGCNVKFVIGKNIKYRRNNVKNLKTNIQNKKVSQSVDGNTNTVYINPLNSLKFVLNKIKKDRIKLDKDFYVFTGSTVGVVPIKGKGEYLGKIQNLGSVKTNII